MPRLGWAGRRARHVGDHPRACTRRVGRPYLVVRRKEIQPGPRQGKHLAANGARRLPTSRVLVHRAQNLSLPTPGRCPGAGCDILAVHPAELLHGQMERMLSAIHLDGGAAVLVLDFPHPAVAPRRGGLALRLCNRGKNLHAVSDS
jgi:hypothetical protein